MTQNYQEIMGVAMTLTPGAKAILAGYLLESINTQSLPDEKDEPAVVAAPNGSKQHFNQSNWKDESQLTLSLPHELEFGLKREAGCRRVSPEQFALEALNEYVAQSLQHRVEKLREMFRQWNEEEVDESEALDDEFFKMLDEDRPSDRKLFPPELKGISW